MVPIFDTFRKFRNIIGSGLKRVATGSNSKRYHTSSFAQHSKILLENVNFDLILTNFNIYELKAKSLDMEYIFQRENVLSYFVGYSGVNIQQQLNSLSSRFIFWETSVDSC